MAVSSPGQPQQSNPKGIFGIVVLIVFLLGFLALFLFGAFTLVTSFAKNNNQIVMVRLADGQTYFGKLNGSTLCNYLSLSQVPDGDKKTKIQVNKGGAAYGGSGCLSIKEPIALTEELSSSSQLYSVITNPNAPPPNH